jgi:hypothetical protein
MSVESLLRFVILTRANVSFNRGVMEELYGSFVQIWWRICAFYGGIKPVTDAGSTKHRLRGV